MEERRHNGPRRQSDRRTEKKERRQATLLRVLTSWRFWVTLWGFALVGVIVFSLVVYQRESSDRAAHRAAVQAQYQQCLAGIPFTMKLNRYIGGVRAVGAVLLLNSEQMHEITPPGTAVYRQQEKNIRRLRKALNDQRAVISFPISTAAECRAQAH
jgi:hypothetical protein